MRLKPHYLAPLHEYTTLPLRMMAQKHGCKATIAPLVSVSALSQSTKRLEQLKIEISGEEKFLGVQLIGSRPEEFLASARIIAGGFPYVKWLDVNAGCPSRNAFGTGGGAALLEKPKLIGEIVAALRKTDFPISVKMRLAPTMEKTLEFTECAQEADFIAVHGRTAKQGYSGTANWGAIKTVKEASDIPVVGNGDIKTLAQGKKLVKEGYCDSFMIGRAAIQNPLVFSGKEPETKEEKKKMFFEYVKFAEKYGGAGLFDCRLKAFEMFRAIPNISEFRGRIAKTKNMEELLLEVGNL